MDNSIVKTDETNNLFSGLPNEIMDSISAAKRRMVLLYITGAYTQQRIAEIIGVSKTTIHNWLLEPAVQTVISVIQEKEFEQIQSSLSALKHKAVQTMCDLMDSNMDTVRYQAAKDILDRGGHKASQQIKVEKTVTTREEQLKDLMSSTLVDVEEFETIDGR